MAAVNNYPQMSELAERFPCMKMWSKRGRGGVRPFDSEAMDAEGGVASSGELHVIRFLLGVFNSGVEWKSGRFDLIRAYDVWDEAHRRAFVSWAQEPFWP